MDILIYTAGAVLAAGWVVWSVNSFITLRNQVRAAWADIDVQLKKRHDLIPRLVEAVSGYAAYEKTVIEEVTVARNRALDAQSLADKGTAEKELGYSLKGVLALAEAYPDLKASGNFLQLQKELSDAENNLQYARRFYNGAVRDFNNRIQTVPYVFLAKILNFPESEFFQAGDEEKEEAEVFSQEPPVTDLQAGS